MNDHDMLVELNRDYINSVQMSDVRRFEELLADDFLCSNPDGSLVDRKDFLKQTAMPVKISGLEARDVTIRLMGDFAIIHARTTSALPEGRGGAPRYPPVRARRRDRRGDAVAHLGRGRGGPEMAPQTPQRSEAPRRSRGAPRGWAWLPRNGP